MAPTFTFQRSSTSTEGKMRASTLGIRRDPGRNFCRQLMPSSPLKTQLLSPSRPPGTLAGELCRFPPGASTNQTQAASRSQDAWGVTIPGLTASLSQRHSWELLTIGLCDTDSPLHSADDPSPHKGRSVGGSEGGCSPGQFCPCAAPFPVNTREVVSDRQVCTF